MEINKKNIIEKDKKMEDIDVLQGMKYEESNPTQQFLYHLLKRVEKLEEKVS